MLLSDRDIRLEIDGGRIALDPWEPGMVQPSSVDVRLDRYFRLFDNHKYPFIDPAVDQPDLTRLIEVEPDEPFILHPGSSRSAPRSSRSRCPTTSRRAWRASPRSDAWAC